VEDEPLTIKIDDSLALPRLMSRPDGAALLLVVGRLEYGSITEQVIPLSEAQYHHVLKVLRRWQDKFGRPEE
jgi:hypothetical protein